MIAGNVGPNSFKALSATGIDVITVASGTARCGLEIQERRI
ncbi:MAG: hypothetical protein GX799_02055 [Crenarchaeota archaeon]|nr:hypothetical protein [Thermoproteota archaeon]